MALLLVKKQPKLKLICTYCVNIISLFSVAYRNNVEGESKKKDGKRKGRVGAY